MKTTDELIHSYLSDLKAALRGADKATIQDALADAEEHLRTALENEVAGNEGGADGEILQNIIAEYGEPEEIAQAYRSWEAALPPALADTPAARRADSAKKSYPGFFGVFADPRAWGGLVYMLISIITGTLYFSWAVTGLATSLGVMVLIIGIPVTIIFLLSFRGIAFLEGRLVESLLGERMPRRASFTDSSLPWKERLKALLLGKATWLSWIYMILMLPLGVIYFSFMVTFLALGLGLALTPVGTIVVLAMGIPLGVVQSGNYIWSLSDPGAVLLSLLFCGLGIFITTGCMHLARWVGKVHGKFAKALLVSD
ncbi:MAG: sensor domain-containing protein [Anaerolineales bacterium]